MKMRDIINMIELNLLKEAVMTECGCGEHCKCSGSCGGECGDSKCGCECGSRTGVGKDERHVPLLIGGTNS